MVRELLYPKVLVIRLDEETLADLEFIASYEHKSRGAMARDILVEKVQAYSRRPDYKAYRRKLSRMIDG